MSVPAVSRGGDWLRGRYAGVFECTFYNPVREQCDETSHITATGKRVSPGYTAAVDPKYWKFGTRFYIEGFGIVRAEDTGSKVKGANRIDICLSDAGFARQLGRRRARVWVLE